MIVWRIDRWERWFLLDYDAGAATALISAIVAATLTFLGTAFAVLLVVFQFASTQLTPRALRVSLSDPLYRTSLGLFVATFVCNRRRHPRPRRPSCSSSGCSCCAILRG